jgi:carboxymethylenebutenolidase
MDATLLTPSGAGPFPGVILLQTDEGWEDGDQAFAVRLVHAGYAVLCPDYLTAYAIRSQWGANAFTKDAAPIFSDLLAAADDLRKAPKVGPRVGVLGFATGGYFALWLAATGLVQAGVSYYGFVTAQDNDTKFTVFRKYFNPRSAPVLLLHGDGDQSTPLDRVTQLDALLSAAGAPHVFRHYARADYEFDRSPGYDDWTAASAAWKETLAFLDAHVRNGDVGAGAAAGVTGSAPAVTPAAAASVSPAAAVSASPAASVTLPAGAGAAR